MEIVETITDLKATDELLDGFERTQKVNLPLSYRSFLKEHNGGRPRQRQFTFLDKNNKTQNAAIHYFYGMHDGNIGSLAGKYDTFNDRLPLFHLPVARDSFGNQVVIPLRRAKDVPGGGIR